ncbi:hypothetical protein [Pseudonocardia sp. ICBG162]|uniref:hypothetical protein n=1 Tax=Pseudonocardia sp. ICBG162 TaxID=2846761 RepID=UPI001CF6D1FE|nr:hypothetical protein [Pseudonocardia sp. ICBG162]
MLITFSFTRLAVQVRRWFEIGPDATTERGARVELLLLDPQPHRGSESAAQRLVVDTPFWRADLFDRTDRPGAWAAAHVHPHFDGVEPSDRVFSPGLTADPWGWLTEQLSHPGERLRDAGLDPAVAGDDLDDLRTEVPHIVGAARRFGPEQPMTRDDDFHLTRDAAERVRRMLTLIPPGVGYDREHLRPWLEQH